MFFHMRSLSKQAYIIPVLTPIYGKVDKQVLNKDILPNAIYVLDDEDINVQKFLNKKMLYKVAPAVNVVQEIAHIVEQEPSLKVNKRKGKSAKI